MNCQHDLTADEADALRAALRAKSDRIAELQTDLRIANEAFLSLLTECADLKRENERLRRR